MRHSRMLVSVVTALLAGAGLTLGNSPASAVNAAASTAPGLLRACSTPAAGFAACHAIMHVTPNASSPSGKSPSDIQAAYGLTNLTPANPSRKTVAIVDAYGYTNAESDLAFYRNYWGLPACTTANGCFRKIDQNGGTSYPRQDAGWAQEQALDLDAVSAACPGCNILLVQAKTSSFANLGAAVNRAAQYADVIAISNSYGGADATDSSYGGYYNHPGIAVTASTGDSGYQTGGQYPAGSQYVVAVGGTTLNGPGNETVWSGAGSGCSAYNNAVAPSSANTGCSKRASADVSADANPNTGLAVYTTVKYQGYYGWITYGGTSLSSPLVAAMYGLKGSVATYPTSSIYANLNTTKFHDVTSGNNGSCPTSQWCQARSGWDGPTGVGTPNGLGGL